MDQILIQTVNGLVNGMILALVASGLTLIFGIMDVVNVAHGDLVMLGGFVGAATIAATGNFWLALLTAIFVPLERLFALHPAKIMRKGIGADLGYYFLGGLVTALLAMSAVWITVVAYAVPLRARINASVDVTFA